MLDMVMELERNGRNLQHFCRELARYFRNLLVAKVAGANTRLIAASRRRAGASGGDRRAVLRRRPDALPAAHARSVQGSAVLAAAAAASGNRPAAPGASRQAGADRGSAGAIWVAAAVRHRRAPKPQVRAPPAPPASSSQHPPQSASCRNRRSHRPAAGPWRDRLHAALSNWACSSPPMPWSTPQVTEANGELQFVTPENSRLAMNEKRYSEGRAADRRPADARSRSARGQPRRRRPRRADSKPKDDVTERALAHPEVQRFQEMFPDAQVRTVRNLKE